MDTLRYPGSAGLPQGLSGRLPNTRLGGPSLDEIAAVAARRGRDPVRDDLLVRTHIDVRVADQLSERVRRGMRMGAFDGDWGTLLKLNMGIEVPRRVEAAVALAGSDAVVWEEDTPNPLGLSWLSSRAVAIAGGTNEIQHNIVGERLLGLPREPGDDRNVPYREIVRRERGSR